MSRWEYITTAWSDLPSFENAEFTVKYYTDTFTNISDESSSAERTWVLKSDEDGYIDFKDPSTYFVSGDELYRDSNNKVSLPQGTIVIEETKAPSGWLRNTDKLIMTIEIEGDSRTRTLYDADGNKLDTQNIANIDQIADANTKVIEKPVKGGLSLEKIDNNFKEGRAQGDATLAGAEFTVYDSANKAVATITTDANGNAKTGNRDLISGTYTVKETKAPTGYKINSSWTGEATIGDTEEDDGKIVAITSKVADDVIRGGVKLEKWDKELNKKAAQGDADFAGIKFEITNTSNNPVVVDGKEYAKNAVVTTLTTNAAGDAQTSTNALPYGSYSIKEVATNGSYLLTDGTPKSFTIRNDGEMVSSDSFKNNVVRGNLEVTKTDAENTTVQGDAALSGIKYAVVTRSAKDVVVPANGSTYQKGEVVAIITTNAQGKASTPAKSLPYGTYDVYELRSDATIALGDTYDGSSKLGSSIYANDKGYLFKDSKQSFTIRTDGETKKADYSNNVVRGGVLLQKVSLETLKPFAQGGASLEGAEFTIYNNSAKEVIVKGKTYKPGEVVMIVKTNENGTAKTGDKDLPYGTYYAVETKRPEGYLINKDFRVDFQIREDGVVVDTSSDDMKTTKGSDKSGWFKVAGNENHLGNTNAATTPDQVARRGMEFKKTLEGVSNVGNCLFEVTQVETGEVHYIMTDPNGIYTSRRFNNNNANDEAVTKNEDGTYTIDESKLSYKNNVWFSMDTDGNVVDPIDGYDAYPYGTYLFKELRTSVNEGYTLITFTGTVYDDEFYLESEGSVYDLGTKDDTIPVVATTAYNNDDRFAKLDSSAEKISIVDKIEYDNLIIGNNYKFMGKLWDQTNNQYVVDEEGNPVVAWSDVFKAKAKSGHIYMTFEIPGSYVNDTEKVVVFESLFEIEAGKEDVTDKDTPITEHIDPNDIEQTLPVEPTPEIGTILTGENGEKAITTDGNGDIILKDTVSYSGLEKGKEYIVSGKMYSKEDKDFVAEAEPVKFTPSASKGTVEVEFKVKASDVVEKHLVAFETLSIKGEVVATHEDPEDPDQTVTILPNPEKKYSDDILKQKDPVLTETKVVYEKKQIGYDLTWVNDTENTATVEVRDTLSAGITYDEGSAVDQDGNKVDFEVTVNEDGTTTLYLKKEGVEAASFGHILYTVTVNSKAATTEEKFQVNNDYDLRVTKEGEDPDKNTWRDINDLHNPVPEIGTTLTDESGSHIVKSGNKITLPDVVKYKGLQPDTEYKVEGKLFNKTEGKLTDITAETIFMSSATGEGVVEVKFTFDATKLEGMSLVAYEYMYDVLTGDLVGKHENPDDPDQTVTVVPSPEKKYSDDILKQKDPVLTETKVVYEKKQIGYDLTWVNDTENTATVEVRDTLSAGITYDEGSAVDQDGNKVDFEVTVNEDGTTTLYLKKEGVEAASFGHILYTVTVNSKAATTEEKFQVNNDYDLRVTKEGEDPDKNTWRDINDLHNPVPEIGTILVDSKTKDHIANAEKTVELKDTVKYKGLQPDTPYKVVGKLFNKTTGKLTNITAEATFTSSKTGEGTAEVTFKFDGTKLQGNSLVAYEYMYDVKTGDLVGKHENPDDPDQTVTIPEIKTSLASDKGAKSVAASKNVTLVDRVSYKGLIPGKEYILRLELMDKATKKATGLKASQKFTASKTGEGTVDVKITIDATKFGGKDLVAFEKAYMLNGKAEILVGSHEDFNDKDQTVKITTPGTTITKSPKTGDTTNWIMWAVIAIAAVGLGGTALGISKKRKASQK